MYIWYCYGIFEPINNSTKSVRSVSADRFSVCKYSYITAVIHWPANSVCYFTIILKCLPKDLISSIPKNKQTKKQTKKTFVFTLCCILTELAFTTHTHTHSHRVPAWQTSPVNWACKSCAQHQYQWRNIHHLQHWPDSASL